MKTLIRKIHKKIFSPIINEVTNSSLNLSHYIGECNNKINSLQNEISDINCHLKKIENDYIIEDKNTHEMHIKSLIKQRWNIYNQFDELRYKNHTFSCPICGQQINTDLAKRFESNCIFMGGGIIRYQCIHCGCIVGPLKMFDLSSQEFDLDYMQHYTVFNEGDTTEDEIFTFYQLNPSKEGVYLNYGCGAWSKSINELRREGYNVYGFEPYVSTESSPYIINNINELKKMSFDGIFTNNVLEHLLDPVQSFSLFKSLLKDQNSIMVHSTPCYEYLYEYTRFHLIFYTGRSINTLCKKTGLIALDRYDAIRFNNNYTSFKYRQIDS